MYISKMRYILKTKEISAILHPGKMRRLAARNITRRASDKIWTEFKESIFEIRPCKSRVNGSARRAEEERAGLPRRAYLECRAQPRCAVIKLDAGGGGGGARYVDGDRGGSCL